MSGTAVVWKYPLPGCKSGMPEVCYLPLGAKVVHFAFQGDMPTLWAEHVSPKTLSDKSLQAARTFVVVATGQEIDRDIMRHVGTAIAGALAWHLYEIFEVDEP